MAIIDASLCPRFGFNVAIDASLAPRVATLTTIDASLAPRFSVNLFDVSLCPRVAVVRRIDASLCPRLSTSVAPTRTPTVSDYTATLTLVNGLGGGYGPVPFVGEASWDMEENKVPEWTVLIQDDDGTLGYDSSGFWNDGVDEQAYGTTDVAEKYIVLSGTYLGQPWGPFIGVPAAVSDGITMEDRAYTIRWSGRGLTDVLSKDRRANLTSIATVSTQADQAQIVAENTFDATLNTSGTLQNCSQANIIAMICAHWNMSFDTSMLAPVYRVARMELQGLQPIKWVEDLLDKTQAAWHEWQGQIVCYNPYPGNASVGAIQRYYNLATDEITQISSDLARVDRATRVIARRSDDVGGIVATKTGTKYGPYSVPFKTPVQANSLTVKQSAFNGVVTDIWVYGANAPAGQALPVRILNANAKSSQPGLNQNPVSVTGLAASATFAFGPTPDNPTATGGSFTLVLKADNGAYGDDIRFAVWPTSGLGGAGYGFSTLELPPTPLIGSYNDLLFYAQAVYYRRSQRQRKSAYKMAWDPWLRINMRCQVTDPKKGTVRVVRVTRVQQPLTPDATKRWTQWWGEEYFT